MKLDLGARCTHPLTHSFTHTLSLQRESMEMISKTY
jgi:hypothetical protein